MKQNPEFIGPRHENDKREGAKEYLLKWAEESKEPFVGESEKTEEEIKMIETINDMIGEELRYLGIEGYEPTPIEKIHFLEEELFKERFPKNENKAIYVSTSDVVYVNRGKTTTKAHMISTTLHELIHRASTKKFYNEKENIYDARVGYRIRSVWKDSDREHRFHGFNEAVNDHTVYMILSRNLNRLKSFDVTKEDVEGPIYTYMNYIPIINSLLKGIAQSKKISEGEVFDDLERGQFQNSLLVLKDVEKAFGKGSLEILSLLGVLKDKKDDEKLEELIGRFFAENDVESRENLRTQILEFFQKSQDEEKKS